MYDKFMNAWDDKSLTKEDRNIALSILCPDHKNKTAIERALDGNRHRSFELMLHLLAQFKHYPLSKWFLDCLPHMVKADSELIW